MIFYLLLSGIAGGFIGAWARGKEKPKEEDDICSDVNMVLEAAFFAAMKHRFHRRKNADKDPYINHPIEVAWNASFVTSDVSVIQACLLHDTVEDTDTTFDQIEWKFGQEVRKLVQEVTDDKKLPKEERKRLQIANASHKSEKAKIIKLADKLANVQQLSCPSMTPEDWTQEQIEAYRVHALEVADALNGGPGYLQDRLRNACQPQNVE